MQTAERSSGMDPSEQVIYNRCLYAYVAASGIVKEKILELGSGEGYGINMLAPLSSKYMAIDKFDSIIPSIPQVEFRKMMLPSLEGIEDNSFDYAVTFQVIEHIKDDKKFVSEIHRVLKPGGKLLLSTPNIKMTLSRNPWHIREYTADQLKTILAGKFSDVQMKGVFGDAKVMEYHEKNKASVNRIMKFDILNLQYLLPRWILKIPYDFMNRLNRRKLLGNETSLVQTVGTENFYVADYSDTALDLFAIATK
jgi:2-polyprenyl-3-methyl-5-hydroxy-6-metoxy-1,4-benzoquinol methylase